MYNFLDKTFLNDRSLDVVTGFQEQGFLNILRRL